MDYNKESAQERIKGFLKEYGEIVEKWKVDFVNFPMFQPNDKGSWDLHVSTQPVDTSQQPVKSFIQP